MGCVELGEPNPDVRVLRIEANDLGLAPHPVMHKIYYNLVMYTKTYDVQTCVV